MPAPSALDDINSLYGRSSPSHLVRNGDALNIQITNLLYIKKGELPNNPDYGANLEKYLFEPCNEMTAWNIKGDIMNALTTWLSDIIDVDYSSMQVIPYYAKQSIVIHIPYRHKTTNTPGTYTSMVRVS